MAALILLALIATANALAIQKQAKFSPTEKVAAKEGLTCSHKTDDLSWGVFMDGRDAGKGKYAYGKEYHANVRQTLQTVYKMVPSNDTSALHMSTFMKIAKELKEHLRGPHANGALFAVKNCNKKTLPEDVQASMKKDIVVLDHKKFYGKPVEGTMKMLFKKYSQKMTNATTEDQKLLSLAWLLQNMAFVHPLPGSNGRSRTMLLQHELRRHGIACGTFMFNNNKDIYFETQEVYVKKLHEGMEMYKKAYESDANPWEAKDKRGEHETNFANKYDQKLKKCWEHFCPPGKDGHKGCEGTSAA